MCGIVGFAGKKEALPILLDGLERLEYRGYDSAGVAVVSLDGDLQVKKSKGRLSVLREILDTQSPLSGNIGIGHTRWATHGEPNDTNAHPHVGQEGKIAVVHNGIIENYLEIKKSLIRKGIVFSSDTDTEVIVQLLEYYYRKKSNLMDAVYAVLNRIKGAYAMGILCSDNPGQMIVARKDAPFLIGYGEDGNYIASDVTALLAHTRTVTYMEDDEVAVITADDVQIFDRDRFQLEKEKHEIEWDVSAAEKGGYAHFMLKEIMEQPEAVRKTISPRLADGEIVLEELRDAKELMKNISRIYIVACGSAYHVGMVGKYALEKMMHIPVEACLASEFRYSEPILGESSLVIIISQSGETLDSMAALREAKRRGSKVLSIVNVMGSSIARESDYVLYTWAGPEIAVATTKAYTTQMVLLLMFGVYLAKQLDRMEQEEYMAVTYPTKAFKFIPTDTTLNQIYKYVERFRNSVWITSTFILLIVFMGLIGYINDETARRSKEIAIRKVNGAEASDILKLLSVDILYVAIPSVLIGTVCAYLVGKSWLEAFHETISLNPLLFVATAIAVLVTIVACVVIKAWKIANENPVKSIKSE